MFSAPCHKCKYVTPLQALWGSYSLTVYTLLQECLILYCQDIFALLQCFNFRCFLSRNCVVNNLFLLQLKVLFRIWHICIDEHFQVHRLLFKYLSKVENLDPETKENICNSLAKDLGEVVILLQIRCTTKLCKCHTTRELIFGII